MTTPLEGIAIEEQFEVIAGNVAAKWSYNKAGNDNPSPQRRRLTNEIKYAIISGTAVLMQEVRNWKEHFADAVLIMETQAAYIKHLEAELAALKK